MRIYNSLTKRKEEFVPLKKGQVSMYVCGVTVYDECHIGHARGAYIFEVIRNWFKFKKFKVKYARNITDIDDKIIARARETGQSVGEIAQHYTESYYQDMAALGIKKADVEPKATAEIKGMISFIEELIKRGFAYQEDGDVYFEVRKLDNYGELSGQSRDELKTGTRIAPGEKKHDPLDFALWKASKEGEPSWKSPWGPGRPGWHIECSTMSSRYLGAAFDIHGGGRDLIFPHHENELAQSRGRGDKFAGYWIHNGLLTVDSQKMSKSLGNFITIKDFLKKHNAEELKVFFLATHYSKAIDYTEERIREAKKSLQRFYTLFDKLDRLKQGQRTSDKGQVLTEEINKLREAFTKAMDDDFNMPQALAALFDMVTLINSNLTELSDPKQVKNLLFELGGIFGLFEEGVKETKQTVLTEKEIKDLINQRNLCRKEKKFAEADKIRDELLKKGITIEDTKDGTFYNF